MMKQTREVWMERLKTEGSVCEFKRKLKVCVCVRTCIVTHRETVS